ncbi:MAG: hypothetical protein JW993_06690 [Sedimentisphaerales bacterium]|nr:hypothetical protein [Sedimentisphaerales bacterium]
MARIIGVACLVLSAGGSAFGQFLVNPMKVSVEMSPGRQQTASISIDNTLDEPQVVDLKLVDLTQGADGVWRRIEVDDPNADKVGAYSCRSWLLLQQSSVNLPPGQRAPARVQITVPRGVSGYYFAAIIASMQPRPGAVQGWSAGMDLEFLIPVIVKVRGRALPQRISVEDVGLTFQRQTATTNPASLATMTIRNAGLTFSRLEAMVRISKKLGGHWRRITEQRIPAEGDLGIIPGVTLNLAIDVGRPLSKGEYQVQGFLYADGRVTDQLDKQLMFEGDMRALGNLPSDAALDLDPIELVVPAAPGRVGMKNLVVFNASEETVVVDMSAALPDHMVAAGLPADEQGRILRGEHFDCSKWLSFQPSKFTLTGYRRQYVMVQCDIPENATNLPQYFAQVKLRAVFPDGQDAGTTTGRIYVENNRAQVTPRVELTQVTFSAETTASRYLVVAQGVNLGTTRILPRCRAVVRTPLPDDVEMTRFEMTSDVYKSFGPMLPMEHRMFSGVLDVSTFPVGRYRLGVILTHDEQGNALQEGNAQQQRGFEVVEEGGVKSLRELEMDAVGGVVEIKL